MINSWWRKNQKLSTLMKIEMRRSISIEKKIGLRMGKFFRLKVRKATGPWTQDRTKMKVAQGNVLQVAKAEAVKVKLWQF